MWNFHSAYIPANKNPRLNECLLQETNKKVQMPFIQMSFKGEKKSRMDDKTHSILAFFSSLVLKDVD